MSNNELVYREDEESMWKEEYIRIHGCSDLLANKAWDELVIVIANRLKEKRNNFIHGK